MKNKLFLLTLLTIALGSCQKEENTISTPAISDGNFNRASTTTYTGIGSVPATFTQKVLLENFTGASYGKCPANDYAIMQLQSQYPDRVITASFHKNDRMETVSTSALLNFVSNGTVPNIPGMMVNRIVYNNKIINDQGTWSTTVPSALSVSPNIGIALQSAVQNRVLTMTVHAGFNAAITGNYKMCVYLIQNNEQHTGVGYDQANSFNADITSPFYNMGNPILNYTHNNVMKKLVTPINGIAIPSSYQVTGGHMIQALSIDLPASLTLNDTYIVTYVYDTGNLRVMNAQIARIGAIKIWD
ncbi:MAG: Omp28-related outer membrane protein [Bacteroidia bacterium]